MTDRLFADCCYGTEEQHGPNQPCPQAMRAVGGRMTALAKLDAALEQIGGCSDGHCIVIEPRGMHTNGGCWCWRDGMKMQRFAHAYRQFRQAIERDGQ
jgi:hypothetical protein